MKHLYEQVNALREFSQVFPTPLITLLYLLGIYKPGERLPREGKLELWHVVSAKLIKRLGRLHRMPSDAVLCIAGLSPSLATRTWEETDCICIDHTGYCWCNWSPTLVVDMLNGQLVSWAEYVERPVPAVTSVIRLWEDIKESEQFLLNLEE